MYFLFFLLIVMVIIMERYNHQYLLNISIDFDFILISCGITIIMRDHQMIYHTCCFNENFYNL
jgi:hypothetical protein